MQPRLDHFIVRPDAKDGMPGPIVPLIAVDQLPDWMQLAGAPRELDAEQTIGLTNLGIVEVDDDSTFEVRLHHDKIRAILDCAGEATDSNLSGNGNGKSKTTKSKASEKLASNESLTTSAWPHAGEKLPPRGHLPGRMLNASRHNIANTAVDVQASSGNEKALRDEPRPTGPQRTTAKQGKQPATAFCRHWCYHGTCKWGSECRYLHRMPTTVKGLREAGLRDFPTWYLLMMSDAGIRLPGLSSMDTLLSGLEGVQLSAQQQQQPLADHRIPDPPPLDLSLIQGHISAPLAPDGPMSSKQKLKLIRERRHLLLRGAHATQGQQQPRPHKGSNYANLYTNARVAANAASIRRQAEHQQQARDNMPVVTRVRANARAGVEDCRDGGGDDDGGDLLPARKGGRASNDSAGVMNVRSPGFVAGRAGLGEEKLVDID